MGLVFGCKGFSVFRVILKFVIVFDRWGWYVELLVFFGFRFGVGGFCVFRGFTIYGVLWEFRVLVCWERFWSGDFKVLVILGR